MTKGENEVIENIIQRLNAVNCGCSHGTGMDQRISDAGLDVSLDGGMNRVAVVSRVYLDTWIVGALQCLIGENRDVDLARRLSR